MDHKRKVLNGQRFAPKNLLFLAHTQSNHLHGKTNAHIGVSLSNEHDTIPKLGNRVEQIFLRVYDCTPKFADFYVQCEKKISRKFSARNLHQLPGKNAICERFYNIYGCCKMSRNK